MNDGKTCFIIMPITVRNSEVEKYRDGKEHYEHVLTCLFYPAIRAAGYEPISPVTKGSDVIHAEIIRNLETADLVMCDMTGLNPNVFFEYGIRTSLNKPVCVVRDDKTPDVPFDTSIINHHIYQSSLDSWKLDEEQKLLTAHISDTEKRGDGANDLWRYFGMKSTAAPFSEDVSIDTRIEYLTRQIEMLLDMVKKTVPYSLLTPMRVDEDEEGLFGIIESALPAFLKKAPMKTDGKRVWLKAGNLFQNPESQSEFEEKMKEITGYTILVVDDLPF